MLPRLLVSLHLISSPPVLVLATLFVSIPFPIVLWTTAPTRSLLPFWTVTHLPRSPSLPLLLVITVPHTVLLHYLPLWLDIRYRPVARLLTTVSVPMLCWLLMTRTSAPQFACRLCTTPPSGTLNTAVIVFLVPLTFPYGLLVHPLSSIPCVLATRALSVLTLSWSMLQFLITSTVLSIYGNRPSGPRLLLTLNRSSLIVPRHPLI